MNGSAGARRFATGLRAAPLAFAALAAIHCAEQPPPAPRPANLVLITLDTLRADRIGAYGHSRPTSPNLDAFTQGTAVRFTNAETASPSTAPSHGTILTGLHPAAHGVHTNGLALAP